MRIQVDIPDAQFGNWRIETFSVSGNESFLSSLTGMGRGVPVGTYKRLMHGRSVVMSNTPAEIRDHLSFIYRAKAAGGDILINGLGLGVCLSAILEFDNVSSVTVVEKTAEVIRLVGPHFEHDDRVEIIHADAFEYRPPKRSRYSVVWHDIWYYICADNLDQMARLHRKYGRRADWQGSWAKGLCQQQKRAHRSWS